MTTTTANRGDKAQSGGFLKPYKPGQGFWTRLGTGIGAALLILFTIQFLYSRLPTWVRTQSTATLTAEQVDAYRADSRYRVLATENVDGGVQATLERVWLSPNDVWLYVVLAGLALLLGGVAWYLINKPRHAEFLINTDTEMKKVNWTTRRELIGSTKVVIFFMFFIAFVLFAYDLIFGYFFYFIDVLKIAPLTA